jgi:hypothetical protein
MPHPSMALRQVVMRMLAQEVGEGATSEELLTAAAQAHEYFAHRLAPLIGDVGVQAIFTRSANLTKAKLPFLAGSQDAPPTGRVPSQLLAHLQGQDVAAVRGAIETLFTTSADLLAGLIGERLAGQVLFGSSSEAVEPPQERQQ